MYVQTRKESRWVQVRESLYVVTNVKGFVDAYRVIYGSPIQGAVDPLSEMLGGKCGEMAFESIPSGTFQTYAHLGNPTGGSGKAARFSILMSVLATAYYSFLMCKLYPPSYLTRRLF